MLLSWNGRFERIARKSKREKSNGLGLLYTSHVVSFAFLLPSLFAIR